MDIGYLIRTAYSREDQGGRPAYTVGDDTLTWAQLADRARSMITALDGLGVRPGERVGMLLGNSVDYLPLYLAITSMGAIAVRLNFRLGADELSYILGNAACTVLVVDHEYAANVPGDAAGPDDGRALVVVQRGGASRADGWLDLGSVADDAPPAPLPGPREASEPAMIMYTSGTTGLPKGAVWTHGGTMAFGLSQAARWPMSSRTATLVCGPMYHVGGLEDALLPTLIQGGHSIAMPSGGFTVDAAFAVIERHGVSDAFFFPFMIYEILGRADLARQGASLSAIYTGGENLQHRVLDELPATLPGIELHQVYGLTEGTPIIATSGWAEMRLNPSSVGYPMPMCEISIRDDEGQIVPDGVSGEIWTRSDTVSREYWRNAEATERTFVDGWCATGDSGLIDEHGMLEIVGRKKDMIRSGGENIYPAELENVLTKHPAVADVAVIGVPDPKWVETVCAVVVLRPGASLTLEELVAFSRERLAGYKQPRRLEIVDELPRTASGKVQKFVLRQGRR
ncbi:class I adenylate-forming enzyme family protein [Cumulibacter manganitolerans]|uniref:class I adenylate-forming enzyme family protein n=1 Tax=Cumulibacter manganitolerans TaxID=1884992 RepID=UPI0012953275|nr:AMP-binding protein [Cumulibacter manganitolerans]